MNVVIYSRTSTTDQTCENQIRILKEVAEKWTSQTLLDTY